jgi:protein-S-isoprenylcysteine O-methyltransferase Ste14
MSSPTSVVGTSSSEPRAASNPLDARLNRLRSALDWGRPHDIAVGISFLIAAATGVLTEEPSERFTSVRLTLSALQLTIAFLLMWRRPLEGRASNKELLMALPSLLGSGVVLFFAQPWSSWPLAVEVLFLVGFLLTAWSLMTLGRSFAVLPGLRRVVVRGPYRVLRHPAYASELLMVGAACVALGILVGSVVFIAALLFVVLRIRAEEGPLGKVEAYQRYRDHVRWRLVPFVW